MPANARNRGIDTSSSLISDHAPDITTTRGPGPNPNADGHHRHADEIPGEEWVLVLLLNLAQRGVLLLQRRVVPADVLVLRLQVVLTVVEEVELTARDDGGAHHHTHREGQEDGHDRDDVVAEVDHRVVQSTRTASRNGPETRNITSMAPIAAATRNAMSRLRTRLWYSRLTPLASTRIRPTF